MTPRLRAYVDALVARAAETGRVDLNDVEEVIGADAVSYDDVDAIVGELEARGLAVGEMPGDAEVDVARAVLAKARELRAAHGRAPTVAEIAAATGFAAFRVRRALEQAGAPGRKKL